MAHPNIDERRAFVVGLLNNGIKIDSKRKFEIAKEFNCRVSAINADLKHFEKLGHQQKISNENPSNLGDFNSCQLTMGKISSLSWQAKVEQWIAKHKKLPNSLTNDSILFFELAFKHTRHPDRAWFGVHEQTVSLVIGGIFLAAINLSNPDHGVWVLLDNASIDVLKVEYKPVKSTQKYDPLIWAHLHDIKDVSLLLKSSEFWQSYSKASDRILSLIPTLPQGRSDRPSNHATKPCQTNKRPNCIYPDLLPESSCYPPVVGR
jgi:hypothetical protein